MFSKLAAKYKVSNPLVDHMRSNKPEEAHTSSILTSSDFSGSFGMTPTVLTKETKSQDQEGMSYINQQITSNTFAFPSSNVQSANNSSFGLSGSGPGQNLQSTSPFGSFTSSSVPMSSPFGQSSLPAVTQTPFSTTQITSPTGVSTSGNAQVSSRSARDILYSFYQQHNPQKVAEVDKLLGKYQGNEEQMFRNLAKKYNMDPSVFGLPAAVSIGMTGLAATSGGFGQPAAIGGGPMFGSKSSPATTPAFGGNAFSSATTPSTGFGFGSLAQAPATPGFGSFNSTNNSPFGSTPFGAARR
jgi:hypothetical protein